MPEVAVLSREKQQSVVLAELVAQFAPVAGVGLGVAARGRRLPQGLAQAVQVAGFAELRRLVREPGAPEAQATGWQQEPQGLPAVPPQAHQAVLGCQEAVLEVQGLEEEQQGLREGVQVRGLERVVLGLPLAWVRDRCRQYGRKIEDRTLGSSYALYFD